MQTPTDEDFRAIGFTGRARQFPRDPLALRMFAAFIGNVSIEQLPEAMKYFPNESTERAWTRVADAARKGIAQGE